MSRLTKWFADSDDYGHNSCFGGCESCNGVMCGYAVEMVEKLAHYEDLEEQGRLIELPCKVEDKVWAIRYGEETDYIVVPMLILEIHIYEHGVFFVPSENIRAFRLKDFGTQVFLTKEEAEAKLKELQGK